MKKIDKTTLSQQSLILILKTLNLMTKELIEIKKILNTEVKRAYIG
jgi:hypothetical protein